MPLEHTVRPAATPRRSIQRVGLALLALLMVTALASCATGNKSDATFYENRDATVQSQMPDVQATTTARFFGGTPTAIATYAPVPALAELTLATSVGGDGSPQNRVKDASGGTIYASARIRNIVSGQVYTAVWGRPDGTEIERVDQTAASGANIGWISFAWPSAGSQGYGEYAVFIYAGSNLLGSVVFTKN
jgi:hypothetical protein